jgi:predicted DCC family thiol-disulfide oxidoreductase YuxK
MNITEQPLELVYDQSCPFCRPYCENIELADPSSALVLIDARKPSLLMDQINTQGLDIDKGMVLKVGETVLFGADAIQALAARSSNSGFVGRVNHLFFKSSRIATVLYPILAKLRLLALFLLGIPKVDNLSHSHAKSYQTSIHDPDFVQGIFDRCAGNYRLWASIGSFGFIARWRKQCVEAMPTPSTDAPTVVDVNAGVKLHHWPE